MVKKIGAVGLVITFLLCSGFVVSAEIYSMASDHIHHYDSCRRADAGFPGESSQCRYLAYYENKVPIYKEDCVQTPWYQYCNYACTYCGKVNYENQHDHYIKTEHTKAHE